MIAVAGASATIASDALMNPFDGTYIFQIPHNPLATIPQSSNNECKSTNLSFAQFSPALERFTKKKALTHFMFPTPQH